MQQVRLPAQQEQTILRAGSPVVRLVRLQTGGVEMTTMKPYTEYTIAEREAAIEYAHERIHALSQSNEPRASWAIEVLRDNVYKLTGATSQLDVLERSLKAETEAKHDVIEALRRVVSGEESDDLSKLVLGILSKHPEAADGVLAASPAPVERCPNCDDTGDVHRADGEWLGECDCGSAPVERVEQEAVAMLLIDDASVAESGDWDIEPIPAAIEKLARSGGATLPLYTTPQPAPTAAQDVAGLVEALELFVRWVDMEQSENVTAGVFDRLKAFRNAESKARAVLAAHQSGGAK